MSHRVWLLAALLIGGLVATSGEASAPDGGLPAFSTAFDQAADDGLCDLQPTPDDDDSQDLILTASHEARDLEALACEHPAALPPCSGPPGEPLFEPPRPAA